MAIDLNGFAVLQNIGMNSDVFSEVAAEARKVARTLVVKKLKAKSVTLGSIRDVRQCLGGDTFGLILDGLTDDDVKSLLTKLDKHNPEVKTSNSGWRRHHLQALIAGTADAMMKPVKSKPSARKSASEGDVQRLSSAAMAAVRKR